MTDIDLEKFKQRISLIHDPAQKAQEIFMFSRRLVERGMDAVMPLLEEARTLAEQSGFRAGKGYMLFFRAFEYWSRSDFELALKTAIESMAIFKEANVVHGYASAQGFASYIYWDIGDYDKALELAFSALKLCEENLFEEDEAWSHHALGVFHFELKDYATSLAHFEKGLTLFEKSDYYYGAARMKSGIGSILSAQKKWDLAIKNITESIEIYSKYDYATGEGRALNDLGVIQKTQGNYEGALKTLERCLELRLKINHVQGIITTYTELGDLYIQRKEFSKALEVLNKALVHAEKIKVKPKIFRIHQLLSEVYKALEQPWKTIDHLEKFFLVKSEVLGEQANNKLKNIQTQYATEKSEREAEIHRLKNVELKKAYEEIEEKNKNILDSINYAKRIQQAILPTEDIIRAHLPESFVFFKPRDVVSGDFYWYASAHNRIYIAAADCTGHGVPGALMSMIGNTLLNEIVNEKRVVACNDVLQQLCQGIIKVMKQTGAEGENKDGMDIALCAIENNKVEYAGAYNPLWIISNGNLREIKADKQPIGIGATETTTFTKHTFELNKGDCLYIFTDGYADQFGGPKGKKFMYKQLEQLLLSVYRESMPSQKNQLKKTFEDWRNGGEQIDDVCVVGVRI